MDRYSNRFGLFSVQPAIAATVLMLLLASGGSARTQQGTPWAPRDAATWSNQETATWPSDRMMMGDLPASNADWVTTSAGAERDTPPQIDLGPTTDHLLPQPDEKAQFVSEQLASLEHVHRPGVDCRQWQIAPDGLIYHSYLAGPKESRLAAQWVHRAGQGWLWDVTMGGRVGLVRYGTTNAAKPEGWQVDLEGAALGRLDLEADSNALQATDYRVGVPWTYGRGNHQVKLAFYHVSAHLGDELILQQPSVPRINYVRDAVVWGHSYYPAEDYRVYGEIGFSFNVDGGAEPWEFQFGTEYSPEGPTGAHPRLFWAINAHLRQEVDYGGNITFQVGIQWRGVSGNRMRFGMQYLNGKSDQYEFFDQFEDKVGFGFWYDF